MSDSDATNARLVIISANLHEENIAGTSRSFVALSYAPADTVPTPIETDMSKTVEIRKIYSVSQLQELYDDDPESFKWLKQHFQISFGALKAMLTSESFPEESEISPDALLEKEMLEFIISTIRSLWTKPSGQPDN